MKTEDEERVAFSVRFPRPLHEAMQQLARQHKRTLNRELEAAAEEHVARVHAGGDGVS